MSIMIPNDYKENNSNAEKRLFDILSCAKNSSTWRVYHSLDIKNSICNEFTESDFVLIIPQKGIFLIEVKGGKIVFENNRFYQVVNGKLKEKNPFTQVMNVKNGLAKFFENKGLYNIPIFTIVAFECRKNEIDGFFEAPEDLTNRIIIIGEKSIGDQINKIYTRYNEGLSFDESIASAINNSFSFETSDVEDDNDSFNNARKLIKNDTNAYNEKIFNEIFDYDDEIIIERALIYGGAGTGKSYLARKIMDKLLKLDRFKKIAFFSHNILYAKELAKDKKYEKYLNSKRLTIEPIKEYFYDYCNENGVKINRPGENGRPSTSELFKYYYTVEIYDVMLDAIKKTNLEFDAIIVDEAQDVVNPRALICISSMLKHKMHGGIWYFIGDFTHQLIYPDSISMLEISEFLLAMGFSDDSIHNYEVKEMKYNCRNSKKIIEELMKLTHIKIEPAPHAKEGYVEYKLYTDEADEYKKLNEVLLDLIENRHIEKSRITILTNKPIKEERKIVDYMNDKNLKYSLCTYESRTDDSISVAKIRRYKGLENDIIILMDLNYYKERDSEIENIDILYIGLTRAFSEVYIFENNVEKTIREKKIDKRGVK